MPRGGMVTLNPSRGSSLTLIVRSPPDRSGGVGVWSTTERDRRAPVKWFKNQSDDTMIFDLLLDIDAIGGPSIERRLRVLRDMGQPSGQDDPPTIRVDGDIWSEDQNITWVMTDWSLGERSFNGDGTLRQQQVKVELTRYGAVSEIEPLRVSTTRAKGQRKRHTVVVAGNDTLRAVALRELGDATRWKDLQRWNQAKLKGVDPDARLRTGTHLVVR